MRALLLSALVAGPAAAAPLAVPHAGFLLDGLDAPVSGDRAFTFALHAAPTGGSAAWSSGECVLTVRSGSYDVRLGDGCGGAISAETLLVSRWLEVSVEGVPLTRVRVVPAPTVVETERLGGLDLAGLDARYAKAFATDGAGEQGGHLDLSGTVKAGGFAGDGAGVTGVDASLLAGLDLAARDARWFRVNAVDPRGAGASAQAGGANLAGNVRAEAFAGSGEALTGVDAAKIANTSLANFDANRVKPLSQDPDVVTTQAQTGHLDLAGTLKAAKLSGPLDTFEVLSLSSPLDLPGSTTCSASTAGRVRKGANGLEVCDAGAWWLVPTSRLRAWFGFDESVGTMALDQTNSARAVSLAGVTWNASGGRRNGYVTFAGTTASYGSVPVALVHGLKEFTVSYWVRKSGTVGMDAARYLFSFASAGNDNDWLINGPAGTGGAWHHFVLRQKAGAFHVYLNGALADGYIYAAPDVTINASGTSLVIAQDQDSVGGTFDATQAWAGDFDELKILDYAISDAEVAANLP